MKKHDIIQSKHVDHIENEKNILEILKHPFAVSSFFHGSSATTASSKTRGSSTSPPNSSEAATFSPTTEASAISTLSRHSKYNADNL
jgi:hypothetical protein